MLRQRLITGPLLILALLALLWGDGRAAELLRDDARVRGMLGSSDGVVLTGFALLVLAPLVGSIVLIVWFAARGTDGNNRYGDDPLRSLQPAPPPDA